MKLLHSLGMKLLAVWLILYGVIPLLSIRVSGLPLVMQGLAIAAGVLILINK